ncbi:CHAD domain-containing protein, partial [Cellulomonas cellasea]
MAEVHRELETTYAVDGDAVLPDLVGALPRGHTVTVATHRLRATYVDTADLRLARAGLTLRRRTGGTDAGWHLKVPEAPNTRSELRLPLGRAADRVPRELERLVRGRTRGVPLVPVARITTRRTVHRVADADGTVLVEVADDRVEGARLAGDASDAGVRPDATTQWREVEVEVVDGGPADLAAVDTLLTAAGLRAVPDASKLRRVLDVAVDDAGPTPPRTFRRSATSGEVVLAHVRAQVETMAAQDLPVRLGSPGSVHAMRVATRRLRSALTSFGPLFLDDAVAPLRADLRELARALGAARDAEVLAERITADLADDRRGWAAGAPTATDSGDAGADGGTGAGAAADRGSSTGVEPLGDAPGDGARGPDAGPVEAQRWVTAALDAEWRDARARALAELDGDRYAALLVALDAFLAAPPLRHRGSRRARTVLPRLVERTWQKAEAAVRRAEAVGARDAAG